jgi:hypothetical protein
MLTRFLALIGILFLAFSAKPLEPPDYWEQGNLIFVGTPLKREELWIDGTKWHYKTFFEIKQVLKGKSPAEKLTVSSSAGAKVVEKSGVYVDCFRGRAGEPDHYYDQLPKLGETRIFIFLKTRPDVKEDVTTQYCVYVDYETNVFKAAKPNVIPTKERPR